MSVIEKLDGVLAKWRREAPNMQSAYDIHNRYGDALEACADELDALMPAIRQAMIDAERYREVRATCCSAEGPSDELASAWMTGDEAAMDRAADLARATGEGEGNG